MKEKYGNNRSRIFGYAKLGKFLAEIVVLLPDAVVPYCEWKKTAIKNTGTTVPVFLVMQKF